MSYDDTLNLDERNIYLLFIFRFQTIGSTYIGIFFYRQLNKQPHIL